MTSTGLATFAQLNQILLSLLLVLVALSAALLCLCGAGFALRASGSLWVRRRRNRRADAAVHAEAVRGIADLERFLGHRDAPA